MGRPPLPLWLTCSSVFFVFWGILGLCLCIWVMFLVVALVLVLALGTAVSSEKHRAREPGLVGGRV